MTAQSSSGTPHPPGPDSRDLLPLLRSWLGRAIVPVLVLMALSFVPRAQAQLYLSKAGSTSSVGLYTPTGITLDPTFVTGQGNPIGLALLGPVLYIADYDNDRVGTFSAQTGSTINADFITGVNTATGLTISSDNNSLFVSYGNIVGKYDSVTGAAINTSFITGLDQPFAMAAADNNLFVASNTVVGQYDATTGATINASLITGFTSLGGIVLYHDNLFVSDFDTGIVGQYDALTGLAINANFITGLSGPQGLIIISDVLYVASSVGGVVGTYDPTTGAAIDANLITGLSFPTAFATYGYTLPATHWLGNGGPNWSSATWASDAGGTATTATPTSTDNITFSATGATNPTATNLDADFTINSLTVSSAAGISSTGPQTLTVNTTTTLDATLAINSGVKIASEGIFTINSTGTLAGNGGIVEMGAGVNLANNGSISVGDPSMPSAASTLSLSTSGAGAVVMGSSSVILIDLFTGAGAGDNTAFVAASDRLTLNGTLDASAGGTLTLGNPTNLASFADGDSWQLFSGMFTINGTLTIDDLALNLGPALKGTFDQTTGIYSLKAVPATHWLGNGGTNWSSATWAMDAGGTPTTARPTAADDITFSATGATNQLNTVLDADFTINSLTVESATGISSAGPQTLTVNNATTVNATTTVNAGVTIASNGSFTISGPGALMGNGGAVEMATNQNLVNNGAISVGNPLTLPVASTLSLSTSGTGAVVMGVGSLLVVDVFTGAGLGDNTGIPSSSDRLNLVGKLDASAGGTLAIGNPTALKSFAGGDKWQLINLNGGAGSITGKLAVIDTALNLTSTQVGNFDQSTGVYTVIDVKDGLAIAGAQDQGIMAGVQGIISDINGRLFNLRAGWGEEPQGSISDSLNGGVNEGVVDGQGDGPESPIARKVLRSRQWEVFSTVNYANINLNSINTQPGVRSQTWAPGVGIERHFNRNLTIGFAANLLETHQSYTSGLGSLDIQGVTLATYASWVQSAFWVDLLYSFGRFDLDSQRNSTGFPVANGDTAAYTNAVQLNGGLSFRVPAWKLVHGPLFGVDWLHVNVDGYSETGGGIGALSYASRSMDSLITRIGWSVSRDFDTDFAKITPQVRLVYERQNITNNNGTSVSLINQSFTATGGTASQAPGQSYMVAGAGVNFQFTPDLSMLITYQGQFLRQDMQAHYGGVRFSYKF